MRILVIDNYDSFVYNLVQYLGQLGAECDVRRNDQISAAEVARQDVAGILLSPGPGAPQSAGICLEVLKNAGQDVPIFGVCLGHQAFGAAFGATVERAPELLHGKTSRVTHLGVGVLDGLPEPFIATRYHSLAVVENTLPDEIEVTGWTLTPEGRRGVVMAMRHRTLPIEGVQFHPESVLTEGGHVMLANWLDRCGHPEAKDLAPALAAEVDERRLAAFAA
jgi:para-aminobenzoate synthetase component 2